MRTLLYVFGALVCVTSLAHAQPSETGTRSEDAVVLNELHEANQLEIAAGQLAQTHSSTPGTKKFGAQLIKDHTRADADLSALAKKRGLKLQAADAAKLASLRELKGAKFDRAFAIMITEDQKAAVHLVEGVEDDERDPEMRAFLDKTLPVLQKHLEHAQELQDPLPHR